MLTEAEILRAVEQGRAVRETEHGPALSREEFAAACGMAMRKVPLTRAIPRAQGGPRIELTDAGRAALAQEPDDGR